jgi:hypothetical protein
MGHREGFGVKAEDVKARLRADFSERELEAAEAVLARCDTMPESVRVQFAVLELAKGDLAMLRHYVEQAAADYRDVLYWAFYLDNDRPGAKLEERKPAGEPGTEQSEWGEEESFPAAPLEQTHQAGDPQEHCHDEADRLLPADQEGCLGYAGQDGKQPPGDDQDQGVDETAPTKLVG